MGARHETTSIQRNCVRNIFFMSVSAFAAPTTCGNTGQILQGSAASTAILTCCSSSCLATLSNMRFYTETLRLGRVQVRPRCQPLFRCSHRAWAASVRSTGEERKRRTSESIDVDALEAAKLAASFVANRLRAPVATRDRQRARIEAPGGRRHIAGGSWATAAVPKWRWATRTPLG